MSPYLIENLMRIIGALIGEREREKGEERGEGNVRRKKGRRDETRGTV